MTSLLLILAYASAGLLGLFTGTMLFSAVVLVPFWRTLSAEELQGWFAEQGPRTVALTWTVGSAALLVSVAALFIAYGTEARAVGTLGFAALGITAIAAVTLTINEPLNQVFAAPAPPADEQVHRLLQRWIIWHRVRVALGVFSFAAALVALVRLAPE